MIKISGVAFANSFTSISQSSYSKLNLVVYGHIYSLDLGVHNIIIKPHVGEKYFHQI